MKTTPVSPQDLRGVFAVPPLARKTDDRRSLDFEQNDRLIRHMLEGGLTRFTYGGNAFLYHITLAEYEELLEWAAGISGLSWVIPSAGPSYGRAMDQAPLLRKHKFPCVMMLPCGDPRDASGLEQGLREVAGAAAMPLILYCKEENNFGSDKTAGLDVIGRLVDEGICVAIKYAIVRPDPAQDAYLAELLKRVDRSRVVSGIGERPAAVHMREWKLPGFTTGSGCLAPAMSNRLFEACSRGDYTEAEAVRADFLPLEDLRDSWGPARVLHSAIEEALVAKMGPVPPFISGLSSEQLQKLSSVARALAQRNANQMTTRSSAR